MEGAEDNHTNTIRDFIVQVRLLTHPPFTPNRLSVNFNAVINDPLELFCSRWFCELTQNIQCLLELGVKIIFDVLRKQSESLTSNEGNPFPNMHKIPIKRTLVVRSIPSN